MKTTILDGIEYELVPAVKEFEYPTWFESDAGTVVKFTDLNAGIVVKKSKSHCDVIGYFSSAWLEHTNTCVWTQVEDPNKIHDKDLVYCWDDNHTHYRIIRFYDAKNSCVFNEKGTRDSYYYQHYEKVPPEVEATMDWVEEARKSLED